MKFPVKLDRNGVRGLAIQAAMYIMLGIIIGTLFFYDLFSYYCTPFNGELPSWALILVLALIGFVSGYLYPDIIHVMVSSVLLPVSGAAFCFLIFVSPAFSPDILGAFSEWFFELARYILFDMILALVVIFSTGFVSLYVFDTD